MSYPEKGKARKVEARFVEEPRITVAGLGYVEGEWLHFFANSGIAYSFPMERILELKWEDA